MKKNILFLLLTLFVSGEVFSQSSQRSKKIERRVQVEKKPTNKRGLSDKNGSHQARIETKEGSIYLGEFLDETDGAYTLKILSGDIITIEKRQVKRAKTPENAIVLKKGRYHSTKGTYIHYSVGFNSGIYGGGLISDLGLGYRLNKNWEVIPGIGFMGTTVNVFNVQNTWGQYKTFSPLDAFNELFWGQNALSLSGGMYFEPSIGITFASKRIGQTSIALTQIFQQSDFTINSVDRFDNLVSGHGNLWIRRVGIKMTTTLF